MQARLGKARRRARLVCKCLQTRTGMCAEMCECCKFAVHGSNISEYNMTEMAAEVVTLQQECKFRLGWIYA